MKAVMTLVAGLALIAPPAPVAAASIMAEVCGEPGVRMAIPVKAPLPGKSHDCCKKGCHAANERKKRGIGETDGLGDGDNCC